MKKILILLFAVMCVSCGNNSEKQNSKSDSLKSKKDTLKIDKKPEGYKSAHQEHYEEFKKDSTKEK